MQPSPPSSTTTATATTTTSTPSSTLKPSSRPRRVLGSAPPPRKPSPSSVYLRNGISPSPALRPRSSSPAPSSDISLSSSPADASSGSLTCPICLETMVTLLQLNRHMDDEHPEDVDPLEKDDLASWFRRRVAKAKAFQPVAVLNQKLKGLDVFEANETVVPSATGTATPPPLPPPPDEAELYVRRDHWERLTSGKVCLERGCGRQLGTVNGAVNCRRCGRLHCEEHTMYQIRLSRSAQHEPVRGYWCRVCRLCYEGREGFNDTVGVSHDRTAEFLPTRQKSVERTLLETTRLEKRLKKLEELLRDAPVRKRQQIEQSVVPWTPDKEVDRCPHCDSTFSPISNRKHHCRLCGKVVCGRSTTLCSAEYPLTPDGSLSVRICRACTATLDLRNRQAQGLDQQEKTYKQLCTYRDALTSTLLPRLRKAVEKQDIAEAERVRKRVIECLRGTEESGKRMGTGKLADAVRRAEEATRREAVLETRALAAVVERLANEKRPKARALSKKTGRGKNREAKDREERERYMMVLVEQRESLLAMLQEAERKRRLDEVAALKGSLDEIEGEIESTAKREAEEGDGTR